MKLFYIKIVLLLLIFKSAFCISDKKDSADAVLNSDFFSYRVILIGDAGEPEKKFQEPVLAALKDYVDLKPDSTLVLFLGDNIYNDGLPNKDKPGREEYERRLNEQIKVIVNSNSNGIFIPGNHDWKQGNEGGLERILNQAEYIREMDYDKLFFLPVNGCPGPAVFDFGPKIRVIILDTQWWFQDVDEKPKDNLCSNYSEQSVLNSLDSLLNNSNEKSVILAAHHPLKTYGPHGGYFGWKDHIFPLRNLDENLWIPLPIIGSLYPLIRGSGVSNQDLTSSEYKYLKIRLESVIEKYSGIIMASGHEHALQILEGINNNLYIVSGAGIWGHVEDSLSESDDTIYAGKHEGFVILDYYWNGNIKLSVIKVLNEDGESEPVFSMWITN